MAPGKQSLYRRLIFATLVGMDADQAMRMLLEGRAPLLGFIRAIVGSRSFAEDVFQELAILLMRKAIDIPNPEAFPGWIRRAARFEARNLLRKHRREHLAIDEDVAELFEAVTPEPPAPDSQIEALERCLDLLSPTARRLVRLKYHDGRSGEEIALETSRPLNTVYVTLSRIHKALGQCVKSKVAGVADG